jgi:PKD repeat protein
VQLSRPVAGMFEVETWRTPDGGENWEHTAVTAGSSVKNVRPVTPRGMKPFSTDLAVVWMHGVYTSYVDYQTSITTILATGGNEPPMADFQPSTRSGVAPQEVAFDASASRDPDGRLAELRWDFGDGQSDTGTTVRHEYTSAGRFFPTLTVVDDAGARSVAVDEVVVGPQEAPIVTTGPATEIDEDAATLNGWVDARNQPTTYRFEYGPTGVYGATTTEETLAGALGAHAVAAPLTGLTAGTSYHYRLVARNATGERAGGDRMFTARTPGPSAYRAEVMGTGGLAGYWRLGELGGATAADETGAFSGSYQGAYRLGEAGALAGDPDYAAGFDGTSGEMTAAGPSLASSRGSVEGWFDWRSGVAVMRDDTSVSGVGWIVALDSSGRLFYRLGGTNFNTGRTTASVRGAWHHVVVTSDGAHVAFYLDGVQIHRANAAITRPPALPWHVMRNGNQPTEYAAGHADEVAVYDRALTADEVLRHYRLGTAPGAMSPR